jgi:hypothetical protein
MSDQPAPDKSPDAANESAGAPARDHLALKIARDDLAVELLANRVLSQTRSVVFAEQRGLALAAGAILAIFGISSWMSIDDKVHLQVDKRIDATMTTKVRSVQEKTAELEGLSAKTEASLKSLGEQLQELKSFANQARQDIEQDVASIEQLRKVLDRHAKSAPRQPEGSEGEIVTALGPLPAHTSVVTGSGIQRFGMGNDTPTGGAFTTEFLRASRSSTADTNGDRAISLDEAIRETRKLLNAGLFRQDPAMAGEDVSLFRLPAATQIVPEGRILTIFVGVGKASPESGWTSGYLSGPKQDLPRVKARFEEKETLARSSATVITLADSEATWSAVEEALGKLNPTANDILILYFSGRGTKSASTSPTASPDEARSKLQTLFYDRAVSIPEILQRLESLPAQHRVLIIDA